MGRIQLKDLALRATRAGLEAQPGALIHVTLAGDGTDATIYAAETGGGTLANPLTADQYGRYEGWLELGVDYDVTQTPPAGQGLPDMRRLLGSVAAEALLANAWEVIGKLPGGGLGAVKVESGVPLASQYGLTGDDLADNAAAYQAALNAESLANGGSGRFHFDIGPLGGDYVLGGEIEVPEGLHITAQPGVTLKIGHAGYGMRITGDDLRFERLKVQGQYDTDVYVDGSAAFYVPQYESFDGLSLLGLDLSDFGQSGVYAQGQAMNVLMADCDIYRCGRDGARWYGVLHMVSAFNRIRSLRPGLSGNPGHLNVYGQTWTRDPYNPAVGGPNPASEDVISIGDRVWDCPSWKGLDTHGGRRITIIGPQVRGCYIGIGIDEGDSVGRDGDFNPFDITIVGGVVDQRGNPSHGPGITCFAKVNDTDGSVGRNIRIKDITLIECGSDDAVNLSYGAIGVSNIDGFTCEGVNFVDSRRAHLTFKNQVRGAHAKRNHFGDLVTADALNHAIMVESANVQLDVDENLHQQTTGPYTAYSFVAPAAGFGVRLGAGEQFVGTITKYDGSSRANVKGGALLETTRAWAQINNDGTTATIAGGVGVASVARTAQGTIHVTLSDARRSASSYVASAQPRQGTNRYCTTGNYNPNGLEFDVFCWNAAGALVDVPVNLTVVGD